MKRTNVAMRQHVFSDLWPYSCTFRVCTEAERMYKSRVAYERHERDHIQEGDSDRFMGCPISCLFCGEPLSALLYDSQWRHVGRHMEEIAFGVVTKPYEDWEFYSDASSNAEQVPCNIPRKTNM